MIGKNITETLTLQMGLPQKAVRTLQMEVQDLRLEVLEGPDQGKSLALTKDIIDIGRDSTRCDLVLAHDPNASARHARICVTKDVLGNDRLILQDLKSHNGTFLEDRAIRDIDLLPGDRFRIGNSILALLHNETKTRSLAIHYFDRSGILVGQSQEMRQIFSMLQRLASIDLPVLLLGETGTGKSTIAKALHQQSQRANGPMVSVNCGALSPTLIESSLFGHEAGAFTGAKSRHKGFFEQAEGGTIFLDEIGELPIDLQPKLLDVLESQRLVRLGGSQPVPLDFRLVTATHKDLAKELERGTFRQDLFYRLSVISLEVPPLRERIEDLPLLIETLLEPMFPELTPRLTPAALKKLQSYIWPGNIRELNNVLARTFAFTDALLLDEDEIDLPHASPPPPTVSSTVTSMPALSTQTLHVPYTLDGQGPPLKDLLVSVEKELLIQALERTQWNVQHAAYLLQINQSWLYKRIKKFQLQENETQTEESS